ncbi:MAG TPA: acetyl-CoA carboxylase biotin carboxyl carrier protein subunit [Actinobacteria bacterium]|nr:acetyl-CoA carboxylase biotin carboxyl carrier protein subunit [Actinomycetota bacterium]
MTTDDTPSRTEPVFTVLRGQPSDEDLAAVIAVLSAIGSGQGAGPTLASGRRSRWSNPAASLRQPLTPGPRAWWGSALPR